VTVSEYLDEHPPTRTLDWLASGSWIGGTFDVWIGELAQNIAWDYLARTRDALVRWETECEGADLGTLERAWEEIYIAEGSDWFWWYYSGNDPKLERGFDRQFRQHLMNVYAAMGSPIPDYLLEPILKR
jgi:alpha-amylase/alpha-mannosidase (GH57 family)